LHTHSQYFMVTLSHAHSLLPILSSLSHAHSNSLSSLTLTLSLSSLTFTLSPLSHTLSLFSLLSLLALHRCGILYALSNTELFRAKIQLHFSIYRKLSTISDKSFLQIRIKIESFLQIETRQKLPAD
jgi:hypothetical protein